MESTVITNTSRGTRNLGSYEIENLANQLESELTGKRAAVFLIPSGGIGDWNKYGKLFSRQINFTPRRRLAFLPTPNDECRRPVITNPDQIRVYRRKYALIYDDVVPSTHVSYTMPEAIVYVLSHNKELGLAEDFVLYTGSKLEYAGLTNFAGWRDTHKEWTGFRKFFEEESEHNAIVESMYEVFRVDEKLLNHISNKGPVDFDPFWNAARRLSEW
jgi:hypothetical protein